MLSYPLKNVGFQVGKSVWYISHLFNGVKIVNIVVDFKKLLSLTLRLEHHSSCKQTRENMNWPLELSDNLLKNKVIVIEDLTVTAGQGLSLATRILENQNDEHLTIHNEITSTNIESSEIASVLKLIKSSDKVILLNSLTTVILCNTLQQVSQFLSKSFFRN